MCDEREENAFRLLQDSHDAKFAAQMFSRAPPKPQVRSVFRLHTDTAEAKQQDQ